MESSEYRQQTRSMKTKLRTSKLQDEDTDSYDRVDSGFGESDSLQSMQSDRSNTNSYSIDDESRNQECSESSELTRKTEQLDINSDQFRQCDDGYKSCSLDFDELLERRPEPKPTSPNPPPREYVSPYKCMRMFSQTEDVRYLLAPFWPMLLHQNDDGDTYVFF